MTNQDLDKIATKLAASTIGIPNVKSIKFFTSEKFVTRGSSPDFISKVKLTLTVRVFFKVLDKESKKVIPYVLNLVEDKIKNEERHFLSIDIVSKMKNPDKSTKSIDGVLVVEFVFKDYYALLLNLKSEITNISSLNL